MIVYFLFQDRLLPVKIVFMCDPEILFILFITDCLIFDGQHIGLLLTNFLDLDIFEMLYDLYAISKYVKLWFER